MDTLPPLEASQNIQKKLQVVQRMLRSETGLTRRSSKLPTLQRRPSLLAYEPIIVRFVKNGDQFFEGIKINISQRTVRNWNTLLAELTKRIELPAGVRQVYTAEGGHRIKSLSELEHQKTYVCGSSEPFKRIDYNRVKNPGWKVAQVSDAGIPSIFSKNFSMYPSVSLSESTRGVGDLNASLRNWNGSSMGIRTRKLSQRDKVMRLTSLSEPQKVMLKSPHQTNRPSSPSPLHLHYVSKPLILTIILNAPPPRQSAIVYMNKHTVKSWEQAKILISENLNGINGILHLFKPDGEEVQSLSQLWRAGKSLIAAGDEKFDIAEFLMGGASKEEDKKLSFSNEPQDGHNPSLKHPLEPVPSKELSGDELISESQNSAPQLENKPSTIINVTEEKLAERDILEVKRRPNSGEHLSKLKDKLGEGDTTRDEGDISVDTTNPLKFPEKDADTTESNTSVDSNGVDSAADSEEMIAKQRTATAAIQLTSDSEDGKIPTPPMGTGVMMPHSKFPPTPSSDLISSELSATSLTGKRSQRLSFFLDDGMCSAMESAQFHRMLMNRGLCTGPALQPQTPQSELSLVIHSMVDMIIPNIDTTHQQTSISTPSNISSTSNSPCKKSRNIAIQTDFFDDHLSTTMEPEEIYHTKKTMYMSNKNHVEYVNSQTEMTVRYLDLSPSEIQLYKATKEKYRVGMVIIEGSFAAVKNCTNKHENKDYLLRVIQRARVFGQDDKIIQEIKIMRMMRHENVLTVSDYWENPEEICMVMEPIEGGDLFDAILHCQHFSEADGMEAMRQLGLALIYLHANRIVHRGVKPENIFMTLEGDGTWIVKLAGFNLATFITEPLTLVCGNEYYRAPEMISGKGYGTKVDVWSVGVIAYILLSGTMPFRKRRKSHVIMTEKFSFPKCYWENVSNEAKDFVQRLLTVSPYQRYSSSQLMQHSWIKRSFSTTDGLSEKLNEYLNMKAKEKVAPVPILTVTALDDKPLASGRQYRRHRSYSQ